MNRQDLINAPTPQDRFDLLYPYLQKILGKLRARFKSLNEFDWQDCKSEAYMNVFLLCSDTKWLNYHVSQIKRFLFVVTKNCILQKVQKAQHKDYPLMEFGEEEMEQITDRELLINSKGQIQIDAQEDNRFFDLIELRGKMLTEQLLRIYQRLLPDQELHPELKQVVERYGRLIAEKELCKK